MIEQESQRIGYVRVSTRQQETASQVVALRTAGVRRIVEEKASGAGHRPALESCLAALLPGQQLIVYKTDRLARSLRDLLRILDRITAAGATFRSLTEPIETQTPAGRMMVQILGVVAEFERGVILERCNAGRAEAVARGVRFGRVETIKLADVVRLRAAGHTWREVSATLNCSRTTAKRTARGLRRCDGGLGEHRLRQLRKAAKG